MLPTKPEILPAPPGIQLSRELVTLQTKLEMLPAPLGIQLSREPRELVTPLKTNGILPARELLMLPLTARTRATKPRTLLEAH
jgi:hypothetical protein